MSEENNTPEMTPNTFCWNEVGTSDQAATVEFYTKLFGWTTEDMPLPDGSNYTMFKQGDRPVAGCVVPPAEMGVPPMWLSYVLVEDIDASAAKAKELGAKICVERVDLPMGSFVVLEDPQGATFAFWKASAECPSEA